jgi:hypothetical protein
MIFGRCVKADQVALHLGVPVEQLQAEGGRLGVNAVRAADRGRVLELDGAALEHLQKAGQPRADLCRGLFQLQRLRGVHNVSSRSAHSAASGTRRQGPAP